MLPENDWFEMRMSSEENPGLSEVAESADEGLRHVVVNEHTLGVIRDRFPHWVQPLSGSVIKGGRNPLDGWFPIGDSDTVRPATMADFVAFRVSPNGHIRNANPPSPDSVVEKGGTNRRPRL